MKKIKLFGLVAILIVSFAFTGCDAILEAFYPEFRTNFGGGGDGGNNITIFVEVIPGTDVEGDPQIAVLVEDRWSGERITDAFVWPFWNWNQDGKLFFTANVELFGIPGDADNPRDYRVVAWLENTIDGSGNWIANGSPDYDEPLRDAEWFPFDDGVSTPDFSFPNEANTNWIYGEAFLEVFEGTMLNREFGITGQRVLNVGELANVTHIDTRSYSFTPAESTLTITEVWYTLWGPTGEEASGYVYTPTINIDYSGAIADHYWLDVEVVYDDGWWEHKGFPIRILNAEEPDGHSYQANINIFNTQDWPLNLPDGSVVNYQYTIKDETDGNELKNTGIATITAGELKFSIPALSYDSTVHMGSSDGVDILRIRLDTDGNGTYDFVTRVPLGISENDHTAGNPYPFHIWAGDLRFMFVAPL